MIQVDSQERSVYAGSVEGSVVLNGSTVRRRLGFTAWEIVMDKQDPMLGGTKEAEL